MKTERRHDLGTNELARWATVWIEKIKPYSTLLISAIVVLLGVMVVGSMWDSASDTRQEAAWGAFAIAANTDDMELAQMQKVAMAEEFSGTPMQEWAFATWADRQLVLATQAYLIDRDSATERLQRIVSVYEQLAESGDDEQLRNRARYGLAQVYELQNRLDDARDQYDQVQGDLEALARARADHLMAPGVKETYDWLANAELPKRSLQGAPGTPGNRPAFEADVPSAGDSTLDVSAKSLEDIFGGIGDGDSGDRYGTEASTGEDEDPDDLFGDEADEQSESDATESSAEATDEVEATDTTEP